VKTLNIVYPNPDPGAALTLISPAEVNVRAIAGYLGKVVGSPRCIGEAEKVNIEVEGGGHIFDAKDGNDIFDAGVDRRGHCAGMITRLGRFPLCWKNARRRRAGNAAFSDSD